MEWISVYDQYPKKENKYIICVINGKPILGEVGDATFHLTTRNVYFYWPKNEWVLDHYFSNPTHWMPLPLPPGE